MTVSDFMSTDVVTVEIPGNRDDVLKILKRTGISGVPVLKEGKLVGIITRRDLLSKSEETQLGLLMTSDPVTIAADAPVSKAAELMLKHNIRRLPVMRDGELAGLISVADIIHAIAQLQDQRGDQRPVYKQDICALGRNPPATCRPDHGDCRGRSHTDPR